MKIVLYMAMSVNGYIAKSDDSTPFVTKTEWKSFSAMMRKTRNCIVGRRTYDIMRKEGNIPKELLVIVVTHRTKNPRAENNILFVKTPQAAISTLKKMKYTTALVCGGGKLNASFLKTNLVEEIYLDIEPVMLGRGIPLAAPAAFEKKLVLLGTKKLSKGEIQLHYKVRK